MLLKNRKRKLSVRAGCLALGYSGAISVLALPVQAQQLPRYRITDLGTHGGVAGASEAFDINEQNQIVGWARENVLGPLNEIVGTDRAFIWLPEVPSGFPVRFTPGINTLSDVTDNPFQFASRAHAINDTEGIGVRITGDTFGNGQRRAFVWGPEHDPALPLDVITPLEGGSFTQGWGISNGDPFFVAGISDMDEICFPAIVSAGFYWNSSNGQKTRLYPSLSNIHTSAYDVSEGDEIEPDLVAGGGVICNPANVFSCGPDTGDAMAWDKIIGEVELTQPVGFNNVDGIALGLHGASIVGWGTEPTGPNLPDCRSRALYWPAIGQPVVNLHADTNPPIDPIAETLAEDLNGELKIVGQNITEGNAIMWEWDAVNEEWDLSLLKDLVNLTQCGWNSLIEARAINEAGWIVGYGSRSYSAFNHAFLLSPLGSCPSDLDGDNMISTSDLLILLANWGDCPNNAWQTGQLCISDINADCFVGTADLLQLLADWGACGPAPSQDPPKDVQDCMARFCCDPENELALIRCLEAVSQ